MVDSVLTRGSRPASVEATALEPVDGDRSRPVNATPSEKVRDLEAAERRLAAVVGFCEHQATVRDPDALLTELCTTTREVTFARRAMVVSVNHDGTVVDRFLTSGVDEEARIRMTSPSTEALRAVLADRLAVRSRNPSGRPESLGLPPGWPDIHSYLAVPIASPLRVYGWLGVHDKVGAEEFSAADEEMARILGVHAGIAYENALLVNDLRRHATALHEDQERTESALEAARMGVWEFDLKTDLVTWSDSVTAVSGLARGQSPTSAAFLSLIHPDDRQEVADSLSRAARAAVDYQGEFRVIRPDGRTCWMACRARLDRDVSGTPSRFLGVWMDITERKSLEAQFRQAQRLEAVGQLAGGVAHDFNNVLTAILGFSALLTEGLSPDDTRYHDLLEIKKAGERAATLTRQLLAFSRKQILQPKVLNVNAIVSGMEPMLKRLMCEDIDLRLALAPELGPVRIDASQLELILVNLVVNAVDAMPRGGKLTIETGQVTLDETSQQHHLPLTPGEYVMLAVSDTGVGMDETTRERIFEPFFTTKGVGKGTGLGLATVYGIVKQSGGYIWVYSERSRGSTFKIYLPPVPTGVADSTARSPETDEASPRGETILLVEDDESVRLLVRITLERLGYRVLEAGSPKEAMRLACEFAEPIHLLLSDVVMPDSEGPPLFDRLVGVRPGVPVLYMSGYADEAIVRHGVLVEDTPFLQKPFSSLALARKIRHVLEAPVAT